LFSGPDVERVPELQFQRPGAEVEVSADDADRRGIVTGDPVVVTSNGTSLTLRARVNRKLLKGVVRIPADHAQDLARRVEVRKP
jgi:predicted molibdopterin-dependent oxidoreductase YjgC